MAKVIKATHYPDIPRTVILVCENPDDPEWVHAGGIPAPVGHTGDTVQAENLRTTPCKECRSNWRIHEFIWTGEQLNVMQPTGESRRKTDAELLAEIGDTRPRLPIRLSQLEGRRV